MAASELGVRSLQLPARRYARTDARLTLVDADAPRNAFQAGDLTPSNARRPGKGLADANLPLDANSHLDQDVLVGYYAASRVWKREAPAQMRAATNQR